MQQKSRIPGRSQKSQLSDLRPFLIAVQFLSVVPIRFEIPPHPEATGRSLLYYPLVGLMIGFLLALLVWIGNGIPSNLHAALLLSLWVAVTGALHLDGLADSADAWIGGLGDREKTLDIMKDPYSGPAALVTLILVLLIKFTALENLIISADWIGLVTAPLLGRTALVLLFLTTPYVRRNGLGSQIADHLPRRASLLVVLFTLTAVVFLAGIHAIWLLLGAGVTFHGLRKLMLRRLGGSTGDTAGALVEIVETIVLVSAVLFDRREV